MIPVAPVAVDPVGPLAVLLTGGASARLVAERLGVALDSGFVLAALRVSEAALDEAAVARLVTSARDFCGAFRVVALADRVDRTVYLLLPCAGVDQRARALRLLTELHSRLTGIAPHQAMLSSAFTHLFEAAAARSSVDGLLDLATRRGWSGVIDADTVHASLRLAQFREIALVQPGLLDGPARRLLDYDREHAGNLLDTLRAYFDCVGDVNEAGRRLELHPNTVRYRLRRVEEVAGLNLSDPDERLLAELQVRLLVA